MNTSCFKILLLCAGCLAACVESPPEGLAPAQQADVTVKLDFFHRPLPEIPLPTDLATRFDATSATGRRINASMVAPTSFERSVREKVDTLDGWGVYAPIAIPLTGPIDPTSLTKAHVGDNYAFPNDAIYIIDITIGSPTYGKPAELDVGNGNFPVVLEKIDAFWRSDARGDTNSLLFEEHDEDTNGDGTLDPGEDTDLDGRLDKPNYFPSVTKKHTEMNLAERADALMTFYERETHTILVRPLVALRPRTTYAVVVTRRVLDAKGKPIGSPYPSIHHLGQTEALRPIPSILAANSDTFGKLGLGDVAFMWSFTTGSTWHDLHAVREGLYGFGAQAQLAKDYPPDLTKLHKLFDAEPNFGFENVYAVSGETFSDIAGLIIAAGVVGKPGPEEDKRLMKAFKYVGWHIFGTFKSPRLFPRKDAEGNYLNYNDMSWPPDLDRVRAPDYPEDVTFWMTIPRTEATVNGKPKGVVILGHGYTGSKTEVFNFHPFFSQMGLAVVAIDNVSHGFTVGKKDKETLDGVFGSFGLQGLATALTSNRSWDQDLDGTEDSGADFWTAYTFHTRDVVRQTAVDYMQLVRVLRAWDGARTWPFDVNGNGKADDLAGDVDGDGKVDVGGPNMPIVMTGGSLGGIMSAVVGGIEPLVGTIAPIAGGGGLIDVGIRSIQGGVKEAVELRMMGPLFVGYPDRASGAVVIKTVVPNLNDTAEIEVAQLLADDAAKLAVGDSVLGRNLGNGEYDCARVIADKECAAGCDGDAAVTDKGKCKATCLTFRLAIASDVDRTAPQKIELAFYKGDPFQLGVRDEEKGRACALQAAAPAPVVVVSKFGKDIAFNFQSDKLVFKAGDPLSPLAEGLGLRRASPSIRRFMGFAQMVLDRADPAVYARNYHSNTITYSNGDALKTHALVLNTVGDMNVPVNTGAAIGRGAGLLDWKQPIAEWGGRTVNQVALDTYVIEAVDKIPRFLDPSGVGVLFDPENLSGSPATALPSPGQKVAYTTPFALGTDGFYAPRLDPPLHTKAITADPFGGISGTFFPYVQPDGKHGFWEPGAHTQMLLDACKKAASSAGTDPKACEGKSYFDHGSMILGALGAYLGSGGKVFPLDPCHNDLSCPGILPPPSPRK